MEEEERVRGQERVEKPLEKAKSEGLQIVSNIKKMQLQVNTNSLSRKLVVYKSNL